jgi:hypothetical protein
MKVQFVTPYRVSHLQRYGVRLRGNVTSVYPPLEYLKVLRTGLLPSNSIIGFITFACFNCELQPSSGS